MVIKLFQYLLEHVQKQLVMPRRISKFAVYKCHCELFGEPQVREDPQQYLLVKRSTELKIRPHCGTLRHLRCHVSFRSTLNLLAPSVAG
jgi:hypothetical protein